MATTMSQPEPDPAVATAGGDVATARNAAPSLAVLRIIPGRAGAEYWTMRCTRCGGIHLDIVKGRSRQRATDRSRCV